MNMQSCLYQRVLDWFYWSLRLFMCKAIWSDHRSSPISNRITAASLSSSTCATILWMKILNNPTSPLYLVSSHDISTINFMGLVWLTNSMTKPSKGYDEQSNSDDDQLTGCTRNWSHCKDQTMHLNSDPPVIFSENQNRCERSLTW